MSTIDKSIVIMFPVATIVSKDKIRVRIAVLDNNDAVLGMSK